MGDDGRNNKTNTECKIAIEVRVKAITHFVDDRRNFRVIFFFEGKNVQIAQKFYKTTAQMTFPHCDIYLTILAGFRLYYKTWFPRFSNHNKLQTAPSLKMNMYYIPLIELQYPPNTPTYSEGKSTPSRKEKPHSTASTRKNSSDSIGQSSKFKTELCKYYTMRLECPFN